MNADEKQSQRWYRVFGWTAWIVFTAGWSVALLVEDPLFFLHSGNWDGIELPDGVSFYMAKTLHVCAYAFAAMLTGFLRLPGRWRWVLLAFWFLHACATEYGQTFVPGRTGSVRDVVLDWTGLGIGLFISRRWWRETREREA